MTLTTSQSPSSYGKRLDLFHPILMPAPRSGELEIPPKPLATELGGKALPFPNGHLHLLDGCSPLQHSAASMFVKAHWSRHQQAC
jgi:hypothetical protein